LPSKEIADCVAFWAAVATIIALPCGFAAVWYAFRQLSLARKAGSAASLLALNDGFRDRWRDFIGATEERNKHYAFGELANALEVACALYRDKLFAGRSADLLENYLSDVFKLIEANIDARGRLTALVQTKYTFQNIVAFIAQHPTRK
jgi:hypothetical protein